MVANRKWESNMKQKYKEMYEQYYNKLTDLYMGKFNTRPTTSFNSNDDNIDSDLIASKPNEDEECEWRLKEIGDYNFMEIETKIGFKLCEELKAFYSTYLLLQLNGKYRRKLFYFDVVKSEKEIEKKVLNSQSNGAYYFPNSEVFLIGSASYCGNDDYVILYDNKTEKVFMYDTDKKNITKFKEGLLEILNSLDVIL